MSRRGTPRIACLGGGTGLSRLLRGLKTVTHDITAIVTLTDDGGSSGRLRRELEMPPPGDVRACLVALAADESFMGRLFQHRFSRGELAGHSFGNLFLAALTELVGSFDGAVAESSRVLLIDGTVVPATTHPAALVAEMDDGRVVAGESALAADRGHVRRLFLDPPEATATPQAIEAVEQADLIVLGPGSLFTSTLPPLLVPGLRDAVLASHAPRVYVCNLLQQPGETYGYRASDHVARLHQHVGPDVVDTVVVPLGTFRESPYVPVEMDRDRLAELGVEVVAGRIRHEHQHDPEALARLLLRLAQRGVGRRALR